MSQPEAFLNGELHGTAALVGKKPFSLREILFSTEKRGEARCIKRGHNNTG